VLTYIVEHNALMSRLVPGEVRRRGISEYGRFSTRESVTNTVCHRDYDEASNVQVRIFDDRLEIWSSGKLPPGITVDKLRSERESIPPNPLIAKPFFLIGYIENWGGLG